MPGEGHRFTPTEDSLAKQISREYQKKGYTKEEADRIGYASVTEINKNPKVKHELDKSLEHKHKSTMDKIRNR